MIKKFLLLIVVSFTFIFCTGTESRTPTKEDFYVPGPPPKKLSTSDCKTACDNLLLLNCDLGKPLADGTSCQKFCEDTIKNGVWLDPDCVSTITNVSPPECPEIETCATRNNREF